MKNNLTEKDLLDCINCHYDHREYAVLTHVRNATGAAAEVRTADAVAISTWPSRGISLHGFEVKVSRSDWTREVKDPAKADEIGGYCHYWWIVTPETKVINSKEELPLNWGWLVPCGDKLKVMKQAVRRENVRTPDLLFVAALLRNAANKEKGWIRQEDIQDKILSAWKSGEDLGKKSTAHQIELLQKELATLKEQVAPLEKALGQSFGKYGALSDFKGLGNAVRDVMEGGLVVRQSRMKAESALREVNNILGLLQHSVHRLQMLETPLAAQTENEGSGI